VSAAAIYARAFAKGASDSITVERADASATATDVRAKVRGHGSAELVGAVESASYSVLVLAADLAAFGEPREGDRVYMRGRRYRIDAADPHERSSGGVPLAYHLDVKG
jgi:hypothetical protein